MSVVSRCSRWLKTCINSVKMLVGNKKYAEEFISNAGVNNIQNPPQRAGSTMQDGINVDRQKSSFVISFHAIETYLTFQQMISANYGRHPFVQQYKNNERSIFDFKYRGKTVVITLNPSLPESLVIEGEGRENWYKEAFSILREQYKEHYSLTSIKQDNNGQLTTGSCVNIKKHLVSEEEFRKCFANPYAYGQHGSFWRRSTILLYKYSSNATQKFMVIPEDTWKRIDNIPSTTKSFGKHAELIMIKDLQKNQEYLALQPDDNEGSFKAILNLEVILSYSPCADCSNELCLEKDKLDYLVKQSKKCSINSNSIQENLFSVNPTTEIEAVDKIKMKITFSNFYRHKETGSKKGLMALLEKDIKLDIFSDNNWKYFFNAAELETDRQKRERDDKLILQYLELSVPFEATKQDLLKRNLI